MGFWPTWNRYNAATKTRISTAKMYLNDISTVIMKYKEKIQVITAVNEFLRFHTLLINIMQITMKLEAT